MINGNGKICKKTLKISVFVSVGITLVVTTLIFCFLIIPLLKRHIKKDILNVVDSEKESLRVIATHNLLEKKVSFGLLLKEVKQIENAVIKMQRKYGGKIKNRNRLSCSEFDEYTTLLYIYQQVDNLNVRAFISNTCVESLWNKYCKSRVNARGLNQLMEKTFTQINKKALFKFGFVNIYDVYDNAEAGIKYWLYCRAYLKFVIGKKPTVCQIAMAYNYGARRVAIAIKYKIEKTYLPAETFDHGRRVEWYYNKIIKQDYKDLWYQAKYYKRK